MGQNQIASLPDAIGDCTALRTLDLSRNRLRALPAVLGNLPLGLLDASVGFLSLSDALSPPNSRPLVPFLDPRCSFETRATVSVSTCSVFFGVCRIDPFRTAEELALGELKLGARRALCSSSSEGGKFYA